MLCDRSLTQWRSTLVIKGQVRNSLPALGRLTDFYRGYCGEERFGTFGRTNGVSSWLGAVGCSSDEPAGGDAKIVVGTEAAYPPFEMIDENGEITGFDAELMIAVGKAAGYDVNAHGLDRFNPGPGSR